MCIMMSFIIPPPSILNIWRRGGLTARQASVVWKVDSAIHWINIYPVDNAIGFHNTYPLDSDFSAG